MSLNTQLVPRYLTGWTWCKSKRNVKIKRKILWIFLAEFLYCIPLHHVRANSAREPTNNSHASPTNNVLAPRRPATLRPQTELFIAPSPRGDRKYPHVFLLGRPKNETRAATSLGTGQVTREMVLFYCADCTFKFRVSKCRLPVVCRVVNFWSDNLILTLFVEIIFYK